MKTMKNDDLKSWNLAAILWKPWKIDEMQNWNLSSYIVKTMKRTLTEQDLRQNQSAEVI